MNYTKEQLENIGGKTWEAHGKCRVYFNNLDELADFHVNRYNTGNISSISWGGYDGHLSNSKGSKLLPDSFSKFWYDFEDNKFHGKDLHNDVFNYLIEKISKIIEK